MTTLHVCGMDPSLRSWGLAKGTYDVASRKISVLAMGVISPAIPTGKQVRQNSKDIEAAAQLFDVAMMFAKDSQAVFVEVPVGSQSSRAMAGYAICCGVLGAIRAMGKPFFEQTPTEIKLAGAGNKEATKLEMIEWAVSAHPEAPWPTYKERGVDQLSRAKAEHMADAVAAIHAGVNSQAFKQFVAMLSLKESIAA